MKATKNITKPSFRDFVNSLNFNEFKERAFHQALKNYSDCLTDYVDEETLPERNLDFISKETIPAEYLLKFANLIRGYNYFTPKVLLKVFNALVERDSEDSGMPTKAAPQSENDWLQKIDKYFDIYISREGSVCLYIKPKRNLWARDIATLAKLTDECHLTEHYGQTFLRLWWD